MPDREIPKLASIEIPVEHFELTLVWPVFVQAVRNENNQLADQSFDPSQQGFLDSWSREITKDGQHWQTIRQHYPHGSGPEHAEYCYFHPFVRNFLYVSRKDIREFRESDEYTSDKDAVNRNLRIFTRTDLGTAPGRESTEPATLEVEYKLHGSDSTSVSHFDIRSCWLYLFDTQVAVLELNILHKKTKGEHTIDLASVMHLQNIVRRVYTPFWAVSTKHKDNHWDSEIFSHVPHRITLNFPNNEKKPVHASFGIVKQQGEDTNAKDIAQKKEHIYKNADKATHNLSCKERRALSDIQEQTNFVRANKEPHTHKVLRELLLPLQPVTLPPKNNNNDRPRLQYEHIQDDRIPMMSFLAIGNHLPDAVENIAGVRTITKADWMRLCLVDKPGNSYLEPYSKNFLEQQSHLDPYVYDRFWYENVPYAKNPDTGEDSDNSWLTTRWLSSDAVFTGVGNADDSFFYMDAHGGGLSHFRRHYFAMFLIAVFHRSTLLQFKHRLAEISDELLQNKSRKAAEAEFKIKIESLQKEFMRFRTLYWFSEVSNQIQAKEIFSLMRKHNGLDNLFAEVSADLEASTAIITASVEQQRNETAYGIGIAAAFLAVMAPVVLLVEKRLVKLSPTSDFIVLTAISLWIIASLFIFALNFSTVNRFWQQSSNERNNNFGPYGSTFRRILRTSEFIVREYPISSWLSGFSLLTTILLLI